MRTTPAGLGKQLVYKIDPFGQQHHHRSGSDVIAIVVSIRESCVVQGDLRAIIVPRMVFGVITACCLWESLASDQVLHDEVEVLRCTVPKKRLEMQF